MLARMACEGQDPGHEEHRAIRSRNRDMEKRGKPRYEITDARYEIMWLETWRLTKKSLNKRETLYTPIGPKQSLKKPAAVKAMKAMNAKKAT